MGVVRGPPPSPKKKKISSVSKLMPFSLQKSATIVVMDGEGTPSAQFVEPGRNAESAKDTYQATVFLLR